MHHSIRKALLDWSRSIPFHNPSEITGPTRDHDAWGTHNPYSSSLRATRLLKMWWTGDRVAPSSTIFRSRSSFPRAVTLTWIVLRLLFQSLDL